MKQTPEAAFETAIESVMLGEGYTRVDAKGSDRERAIFPDEALAVIRATQGKVWEKLEALHGEQTGARVLGSLCKWLDIHGTLAMLRHGFKCFGKTLRIAFFRPAHGLTALRGQGRARYLGHLPANRVSRIRAGLLRAETASELRRSQDNERDSGSGGRAFRAAAEHGRR